MAVCSASPVSPGLAIDHLARFGWSPPYSLAHLGVVGEPAGGDEHALPGAHRHGACRRARCARRRRGRPRRRGRRAAPRSRPGCRGRGRSRSIWPISDAPFVSSAWPPSLGAVGADHDAGGDGEAAHAAVVVRQRPRLVRHHRQADALGQAGLQPVEPVAEHLAVARHRLDASADVVAALGVRVVVAVAGAADEAHSAALRGTRPSPGPAVRKAWRRSVDDAGPTSPTTASKCAIASS